MEQQINIYRQYVALAWFCLGVVVSDGSKKNLHPKWIRTKIESFDYAEHHAHAERVAECQMMRVIEMAVPESPSLEHAREVATNISIGYMSLIARDKSVRHLSAYIDPENGEIVTFEPSMPNLYAGNGYLPLKARWTHPLDARHVSRWS